MEKGEITLDDVETLPIISLSNFFDEDDEMGIDSTSSTESNQTSPKSYATATKSAIEKPRILVNELCKTKKDAMEELQRIEQYKKDLEKIIKSKDNEDPHSSGGLENASTSFKPPKPALKIQVLKDVSDLMFSDKMMKPSCNSSKSAPAKTSIRSYADESSDDELVGPSNFSKAGKEIKAIMKVQEDRSTNSYSDSYSRIQKSVQPSWKAAETSKSAVASKRLLPTNNTTPDDKNILHERTSGFRIINPKLSANAIEEKMSGKKIVRLFGLGIHFQKKDCEEEAWVTFGVVTHKSETKKSQNGKNYSIWSLNDLKDCQKSVKFFLFGEVYTTLWKTTIGSVVAILSPTALENRNQGEVAITINNSQRLLILGTSKDMGRCKVKKRDGNVCGSVVNLAVCEFCVYHVQNEYKKSSSKRTELQASYSGVEPKGIKNRILKDNYIYGGQIFTVPNKDENSKKRKSKDHITLDSLRLQKKAKIEVSETKAIAKSLHLTQNENEALKTLASNSDFLGEMLVKPTAGSRNLLKHVTKDEEIKKKTSGVFKPVTAADLIKLHKTQLLKQGNIQNLNKGKIGVSASSPCLGRGLKPGDNIGLTFYTTPPTPPNPLDRAKLAAIAKLKTPIVPRNPNEVKNKDMRKSEEFQKKVMEKLEESSSPKGGTDGESKIKSLVAHRSYTKEEIEKITRKKSNHHNQVEEEEDAQQELYFMKLQKKEAMEERMQSIMELKCFVVSCKQCHYTAHKPSEYCLNEKHTLTKQEATKRYFACSSCKTRTWSFTKIPKDPCRNCGSGNFTRTSMGKAKAGPKLDSETLLLRGEERKFLNSMK